MDLRRLLFAPAALVVACGMGGPDAGDKLADTALPLSSPPLSCPPPPTVAALGGDPFERLDEMGALDGTAQVTQNGAFTYTIPIWVPEGRAGLQPEVQLTYSSHEGNGLAGLGWSIAGGSQIHRCGKNLNRDGEVHGVDYTADDNFCLDGGKLIKVEPLALPETMWTPALPVLDTYRTEYEAFSRVIAFGNGVPERWAVISRDGLFHYYGVDGGSNYSGVPHQGSSSVTLAWLRHRTEDRHGNLIDYTYAHPTPGSARAVPASIEWGRARSGPYALASKRRVDFVYESRPDKIHNWQAGLDVGLDVRLDRVEVFAPETPGGAPVHARTYDVTYEYSTHSFQSLLSDVQLCSPYSQPCLPPTHFDYPQPASGDAAVEYELADVSLLTGAFDGKDWTPAVPADLNGDGADDVVYHNISEHHDGGDVFTAVIPMVLMSNGEELDVAHTYSLDGFFQRPDPSNVLHGDWYLGNPNINVGSWYTQRDLYGPLALDVNGDGRDELLLPYSHNGSLFLELFDTTGTTALQFWAGGVPDWYGLELPMAGDVNGDGLADVYTNRRVLSDYNPVVLYGGSMGGPHFSAPEDVVLSTSHSSWTSPAEESRRVDLDGDGRTDILDIRSSSAVYQVAEAASPTGNDPAEVSFAGPNPVDSVPADINGDGLTDFVYPYDRAADGSNLYTRIEINTGNGFISKTSATVLNPVQGTTPTSKANLNWRVVALDMNRDGRMDLLTYTGFHNSPLIIPMTVAPGLVVAYLSTGDDFVPVQWSEPVAMTATPLPQRTKGVTAADVDGDGVPEVVNMRYFDEYDELAAVNGKCPGTTYYDGPLFYVWRCWGAAAVEVFKQKQTDIGGVRYFDLMSRVTTGLGLVHDVTHDSHGGGKASLPDKTYTAPPEEECGPYPVACVRKGLPLVREIRSFDDDAPLKVGVKQYRYYGAREDVLGRGYLGMAKRTVRDEATGLETVTHYDQTQVEFGTGWAYPSLGMVTATETRSYVDGTLPRQESETTYDRRTTSDGSRFYSVPQVHVSRTYADGTTTEVEVEVTTTTGHDEYATPTSVVVATSGGRTRTTKLLEVINDPKEWLLGLPQVVEETSLSADEQSLVRRRHTYDLNTGSLRTTEVQPGQFPDPKTWSKTTYTLGPSGNLESELEEIWYGTSRQHSYIYDADGIYVAAVVNPKGHTTQAVHNPALGGPVAVSDELCNVTEYAYDVAGRPTAVRLPTGAVAYTRYEQSPAQVGDTHGMRVVTDLVAPPGEATEPALPLQTVVDYIDAYGRRVGGTRLNANGEEIWDVVGYDAAGRVAARSPAGENPASMAYPGWTHVTYDGYGRPVTTVREPRQLHDGGIEPQQTASTAYVGTLEVTYTDFTSRQRTVRRTADGDLAEVVRYDGTVPLVTRYRHGAFGRVLWVEGPAGNKREFSYDTLNRKISDRDPNLASPTLYEYDGFGRLVETTRPSGDVYEYTYDALDRTISRSTPDGVDAFFYDSSCSNGVGQLCSSTSADGVLERYDYDALGRLVERSTDVGGVPQTATFAYDTLGRLSELNYPSNGTEAGVPTVGYEYGPRGYLKRVYELVGSDERNLLDIRSRDSAGRVLTATYGEDAATARRRYDEENGRIAELSVFKGGSTFGAFRVGLEESYDPEGRVSGRTYTHQQSSKKVHSFVYDGLGRLERWTRGEGFTPDSREYSFSAAGNLVSVVDTLGGGLPSAKSYSYSSIRPSLPDAYGGSTYQYDLDGRRVAELVGGQPRATFSFDSYDKARSGTVDQETFTSKRNAGGGTVEITTGDASVRFFGDLRETRHTLEATHDIFKVRAEGALVATLHRTNGELEENRYHVAGAENAASFVFDDNGDLVEERLFTPYGVEVDNTWITLLEAQRTVAEGFAGHRHDGTGLIDMGARHFDPSSRQFLSLDPAGDLENKGLGLARTTYAALDPVNRSDPNGMYSVGGIASAVAMGPSIMSTFVSVAASMTGGSHADSGLTSVGEVPAPPPFEKPASGTNVSTAKVGGSTGASGGASSHSGVPTTGSTLLDWMIEEYARLAHANMPVNSEGAFTLRDLTRVALNQVGGDMEMGNVYMNPETTAGDVAVYTGVSVASAAPLGKAGGLLGRGSARIARYLPSLKRLSAPLLAAKQSVARAVNNSVGAAARRLRALFGRGSCPAGMCPCFVAGTLVATGPQSSHIKPIEHVMLGDEVGPPSAVCRDVNLDEWAEVHVRIAGVAPAEVVELRMLKPYSYLHHSHVALGEQLSVDLPELNLSGVGQVTHVGPFHREGGSGSGCPVVATVRHRTKHTMEVRLSTNEVIETTPEHPFLSSSRGRWVSAVELEHGEELLRSDGRRTTIVGLARRFYPAGVEVFNLAVLDQHEYSVGESRVRVHNTYPPRVSPGSLPAPEEAAVLETLGHIDAGTKPTGALKKKWATRFKNWAGDLPGGQGADSPYLEFRVRPGAGTKGAGARRVVVDSESGSVFYTWTHYGDAGAPAFVRIR